MFKKLFIPVLLIMAVISSKAEEGQKVNSKVQKVVVFLNGAQVTRTATASIKPGTSTLVFGDISPDIDVQSLQVHGSGAFTILSVKQELNFLNEQNKQKQIQDLRDQQKALQEKIDLLNDVQNVYKQEEDMMLKNQIVTGQNNNLDLVKLRQALDFQTAELTELKKKQQAGTKQVQALNIELQKYSRQIAEVSRGSSNITSNVMVNISSPSATQGQFTISYVVRQAGWFPTYDIRAKDVKSPISITYKANVSQQCGEEWKDIKLTLSTGNPSVSGSKPLISPYLLNYGMYYKSDAEAITKTSGRVIGRDDGLALPGVTVKVKGTSIGAATDANGSYSIQVPPGHPVLVYSYVGYETQERPVTGSVNNVVMQASASALNEVVVTGYGSNIDKGLLGKVSGVQTDTSYFVRKAKMETIPIAVAQNENQTNIDFDIKDLFTVPGDGKQYTVEINKLDLDAAYEYSVVPKLNTDVFLTAKLTDWNKYNFLSGEANLFFEGTFIGRSLIDTHTAQDTLNLSLGTDKNIVVSRILQKNLTEKQIFGSNKKETKDWVIEVKNRKSQPVTLLVEDQVPVSQNSGIDVETQELSGGKLTATTGKVAWTLALNPQEDKKVELRYQVRYPKDQTVIIQ